MQIKKTLFAACLLVMGSLQALPANAGSDNSKASGVYEVHYAKAELGTVIGSKRLFVRIQETANLVCADEFGMERFLQRLNMQRCVKAITKELVGKVGHKNLDIIYASNKAMVFAVQRPKTMRHTSR